MFLEHIYPSMDRYQEQDSTKLDLHGRNAGHSNFLEGLRNVWDPWACLDLDPDHSDFSCFYFSSDFFLDRFDFYYSDP